MNLQRMILLALAMGVAGAAANGQTPQDASAEKRSEVPPAPQSSTVEPKADSSQKDSARAEAYYNYTMGHIYEQQYEATSTQEYATKAIDAYK
jgi:hypothetical protein